MGCGPSSVASGGNLGFPSQYSTDIDLNNLCNSKLVLLGAGESGKSTLFRQFQSLYTRGFTTAEREHFRRVVHQNVITSMQRLCKNSLVHGRTLANELRRTARVYVRDGADASTARAYSRQAFGTTPIPGAAATAAAAAAAAAAAPPSSAASPMAAARGDPVANAAAAAAAADPTAKLSFAIPPTPRAGGTGATDPPAGGLKGSKPGAINGGGSGCATGTNDDATAAAMAVVSAAVAAVAAAAAGGAQGDTTVAAAAAAASAAAAAVAAAAALGGDPDANGQQGGQQQYAFAPRSTAARQMLTHARHALAVPPALAQFGGVVPEFTFFHEPGPELRPDAYASWQAVLEQDSDSEITFDLGNHVMKLWHDPGVMWAYQWRSNIQLADSASYYFSRLHDVVDPQFLPTDQDILRSRAKSTGIDTLSFTLDGCVMNVIDVGGQRSERRKWVRCFRGVTAIIFVASVAGFDMPLYEDTSVNRLTEELALFSEICHMPALRETPIILFLNKCDVLYEKIEHDKVPFRLFFPAYDGPNTYASVSQWIRRQFERVSEHLMLPPLPASTPPTLAAVGALQGQKVYTHLTCATDPSNIAFVFHAVKDIIVKASLRSAGLAV